MARSFLLLSLVALAALAEHKPIFPAGVKPIGPYTPGLDAGAHFYVSGQGSANAQGQIPAAAEAQVRQCLDNVKAVLEAGGLSMAHVVYAAVYLADIKNHDTLDKVWASYFPKDPPARVTVGVVRMPGNTPVEISAVAVKNLKDRKALGAPPRRFASPVSAAVQSVDRVFLAGALGIDAKTGRVPRNPREQLKHALQDAEPILKNVGLEWRNLAYANIYITPAMPLKALSELLTEMLPEETAMTVIQVASLPFNAEIAISGVASKSMKRMGHCAAIGTTFYCTGRSGTIRQSLEEIKQDLLANKLGMEDVVASNVYLSDIDQFGEMNKVYASYFPKTKPTRTTVQPYKKVTELTLAPATGAEAKPDDSPRAQISVIAVGP